MPPDDDLAALLARPTLPAGFDRWRVTLAAGAVRATTAAEWAGALVLVLGGPVDVECSAGRRHTFGDGDLLSLGWLPLRALRNPGELEVTLLAVRRSGDRPRVPFLHVVHRGEE